MSISFDAFKNKVSERLEAIKKKTQKTIDKWNGKSQLMSDFQAYLDGLETKNGEKYDITSEKSIFDYKDEFSAFLATSEGSKYSSIFGSAQGNGFKTSSIENVKFGFKGKFMNNEEEGSDKYTEADAFAGVLNDLMEDPDFKKAFDTDGTDGINDDEYKTMLNALNVNNDDVITFDEISSIMAQIKDGTFDASIFKMDADKAALQDEAVKTAEAAQQAAADSAAAKGSNGATNNGKVTKAMTDKDIQNMSLDELKEELSEAETKMNNALEAFNAELAKQIQDAKTEIENQNNEITKTQESITEAETTITNLTSQKESLNSEISGLDSQISALKSKQYPVSDNPEEQAQIDAQKQADEAQIAQLEAQKAEKEAQLTKIEADLAAAEENKTTLEQTLTQQQTELETKQTALSDLEAQANSDASASNSPEAKAYLQEKANYDAINARIATLEQIEANKQSGSALPGIYEGTDASGNPITYHTVLPADCDSIEEFQRKMAIAGMMNIGQYGTKQCFNYSQEYVEYILGVADSRIYDAVNEELNNYPNGDTDTAGYMATQAEYNRRECRAVTGDLTTVQSELLAGRPCVVEVAMPTGVHYVAAIGISDNGDILIMDSYNGSISRLGDRRTYGGSVYVYQQGYHYENSDHSVAKYSSVRS